MSIETTTSKAGPYSCNGALTEFAFPYKFFVEEDLVVVLTDPDGDRTTLTLDTHYTVTATNSDFSEGGTVTTIATYDTDYTITITREIDPTQESDYRDDDNLPADRFEEDLDKGAMIDQQIIENFARTLKVPVSDPEGLDYELPIAENRKGNFLAFTADTGEPVMASGATIIPVTPFMETVLDDTTAGAARTTLDVYSQAEVDAIETALQTDIDNAMPPTIVNVGTGDWPYTAAPSNPWTNYFCSTGSTAVVFNLPAASGSGKVVGVFKVDSPEYIISITPNGTDNINGANEVLPIIGQYERFILIDRASSEWMIFGVPTWHKFDDPPTGWKVTKTSWAAADNFTSGLEVTFSECPAGTRAILCVVNQYTAYATIFWRPSGDTNISNTPNASGEYAHVIQDALMGVCVAAIWLSADLKAQFTVSNTSVDMHVSYPLAYLL